MTWLAPEKRRADVTLVSQEKRLAGENGRDFKSETFPRQLWRSTGLGQDEGKFSTNNLRIRFYAEEKRATEDRPPLVIEVFWVS
jgi:hypothetical protein